MTVLSVLCPDLGSAIVWMAPTGTDVPDDADVEGLADAFSAAS